MALYHVSRDAASFTSFSDFYSQISKVCYNNIIEAVQKYPQIIEIFQDYGLGCVGCMASHFETIGEGAGAHGIDVDALIADLNDCIAEG